MLAATPSFVRAEDLGGVMRFSWLLMFATVNFLAVLTVVWFTTGLVDYSRAGVIALGISMILKMLSS